MMRGKLGDSKKPHDFARRANLSQWNGPKVDPVVVGDVRYSPDSVVIKVSDGVVEVARGVFRPKRLQPRISPVCNIA